jgi:hypothetical protein
VRLTFIQLNLFATRWKRLGLDDESTRELENQIMHAQSSAPLVRGTGGARKIRFAPLAWHAGKSGSIRVIYAYFQQFETVLLITAYAKTERANITDAEAKTIKQLLDRAAQLLRGD